MRIIVTDDVVWEATLDPTYEKDMNDRFVK